MKTPCKNETYLGIIDIPLEPMAVKRFGGNTFATDTGEEDRNTSLNTPTTLDGGQVYNYHRDPVVCHCKVDSIDFV